MESLRPGALVVFVGPPAPVEDWPNPEESGAILTVTEDELAHVVWERSKNLVAWPPEWLRVVGDGRENGARNNRGASVVGSADDGTHLQAAARVATG